jgi:N-acetylmuramoyl-L-alanine amidase
MPAVLLEAGSIINRDEELLLNTEERRSLIAAAVSDAVETFCASRPPRTSAPLAQGAGGR